MDKKFMTITEQIQLLKDRKLVINNINTATNILETNNYYYLINGYKELFINCLSNKEEYIKNTTIEEIYNLYEFDRKIRNIFLEYILLIERKIDTYIAYTFSEKHGHKNYLIQSNFDYNSKNKTNLDNLLNSINLEISHQYKNSNKMIVHYLDKYEYIPLWVLIRILSFGKVSKFYSFMKPKEKNEISRKFNLKSDVLKVYLTNLGEIRNICAHGEKLYDVKLRFKISDNIYHSKLKLRKIKGNYTNGVQDLFSVVIILKEMLETQQFNEFYKLLIKNINNIKLNIINIEFDKVLEKMGFPLNYKQLLNM